MGLPTGDPPTTAGTAARAPSAAGATTYSEPVVTKLGRTMKPPRRRRRHRRRLDRKLRHVHRAQTLAAPFSSSPAASTEAQSGPPPQPRELSPCSVPTTRQENRQYRIRRRRLDFRWTAAKARSPSESPGETPALAVDIHCMRRLYITVHALVLYFVYSSQGGGPASYICEPVERAIKALARHGWQSPCKLMPLGVIS